MGTGQDVTRVEEIVASVCRLAGLVRGRSADVDGGAGRDVRTDSEATDHRASSGRKAVTRFRRPGEIQPRIMRGKLWLAGLLSLVCSAGAIAALPRVAAELRRPLANVARLPERLWAQVVPPRVPKPARLAGLTEPEQETVRMLARRLDGLIVWSSNRSGHHQLYLIDLRAPSVRQLTHHPHVNFYGRVSPDGTQVAFMRSQRPWVSY